MKIKIILFVTFLLFSTDLYSNDIKIETNVNNKKLDFMIGDKIEVNYFLTYPNNLKLILPNIYSQFNNFEILDYSFDTVNNIFTIIFTSYEFGDFEIPALIFNFEDTISSRIFVKSSENFIINIDSIHLGQNPQLKEISYEKLPENELNYFLLFTVISFLIFFSFLLFKIFKNKKR